MRVPRSRQVDALRETVHLGSARAAAALARLLSDAPVLIEVPRVVATGPPGLGWLLGGRDARVVAATFDVGGDVSAELWWVLPAEAARRLGQRLLQRTSGCGVVAASEGAALAEAANIVASSCCSAMGTMLGARMVPSTPRLQE
ncbi:MAG: chemotaxis protein CheC, partial [Myxococcaceae bacterium]|nr:chemotaxis protein CheC [Myxococcaceae bacterium]